MAAGALPDSPPLAFKVFGPVRDVEVLVPLCWLLHLFPGTIFSSSVPFSLLAHHVGEHVLEGHSRGVGGAVFPHHSLHWPPNPGTAWGPWCRQHPAKATLQQLPRPRQTPHSRPVTWRFSSSPSPSSDLGGAGHSPCPLRAAARFSCCPRWYFSMRAWSWRLFNRITVLASVRDVALISKMVCSQGGSVSTGELCGRPAAWTFHPHPNPGTSCPRTGLNSPPWTCSF